MPQPGNPPRPVLGLSVGITGHRPPVLNDDMAQAAAPRLATLLSQLAVAAVEVGARHSGTFAVEPFLPRLVCPLAEGADQIAAEAALDKGYALDVILPMPNADYRADFADGALGRFDQLLAQAQRVIELPLQTGGREEGYALAGRATIAHSDVLIALWDGGPARGPGGTAEILELALRRGIPVIHVPIDPAEPTHILWSGYADLVHHSDIATMPRRLADADAIADIVDAVLAPPTDPQEALHLREYLGERERRARPRIEYPLLLTLLGVRRLRFSTLMGPRYLEATRDEWNSFHDACGGGRHGVDLSLDVVETRFSWADRLAQHFAQIYRSGHVLNFALGALAVLIALSGMVFPQIEAWAAFFELMAILAFVLNTYVGTRRQWHRRWLEYRQLAERIRPMRSLKLLAAAVPPGLGEDMGPTRRWIEWYAAATWRDAGFPCGLVTDTQALIKALVAEELSPQIDYHHSSALQMHRLDHGLHRIGMLLFIGSLISCIVCVLANLIDHDFAVAHAHIFVAFSAGLPAMGAAIYGIRMQGDFGATAQRSLVTANALGRITEALGQSGQGLARQTDLIEAAAAAMLSELDDWHRAYAQRKLELP